MKIRHQQKLVVLSLGLAFLFNIPLVLVFAKKWTLFGFPAFYVFTFLFWILSIVISYVVMSRHYD